MDRHVLLLHGFGGSGPSHWQRWLREELAQRGVGWDFPELPEPDRPVLAHWLAVLRDRLSAVPDGEVVVVAHSCACTLWLHHTREWTEDLHRVDRVLLVAPPGPRWSHPDLTGFDPPRPDPPSIARAAGKTRLVGGDDDPACTPEELAELAGAIGVAYDLIPGGVHLNTASGYGPWNSVLDWVLDEKTALVAAR
ncbi:RBBP9/YdeN family alpha/beta hydrolase [Amycolatopsis umgeniensis]|uniref:Putative alpha/beta hydrolase family esterase n=1 Tax=Amycolatopsis umgeniensis TaxID=336628 RepID=A0A841BFI7_9PSEU|nr:putative alpha/beta hydrolase family esterase [Amycolatopsis umgeniensis]